MPLSRYIKATIKQGIRETMEAHVTEDGIDKDDWTKAIGAWLEATHPDYNQELMIDARNVVLRQILNDYIRGTRQRDPSSVFDIADLKHEIELNNRIVQIKETSSTFRAKRIGDVTMREVGDVLMYYRQFGRSVDRRIAFYAAIYREMENQGCGPDDRVAVLLQAA